MDLALTMRGFQPKINCLEVEWAQLYVKISYFDIYLMQDFLTQLIK